MMGNFWAEFLAVIIGGGVLMLPLFMLALAIYWLAFDTYISLPVVKNITDQTFKSIITPQDAELFEKQRLSFFKNRRTLLKILITTAPLLGLLGTVMGMLVTFQALNVGNGNLSELIAAGISEAMITTETGLVIAIPASIIVMLINSRIDAIELHLRLIVNRYRKSQYFANF